MHTIDGIKFKWHGKQINSPSKELSKTNYKFYSGCILGKVVYNIGTGALVLHDNKIIPACIHYFYEDPHAPSKLTKYNAGVEFFHYPKDIINRLKKPVTFQYTKEIIKKNKIVFEHIPIHNISLKCSIIYGLVSENPEDILNESTIKSGLIYVCRYIAIQRNDTFILRGAVWDEIDLTDGDTNDTVEIISDKTENTKSDTSKNDITHKQSIETRPEIPVKNLEQQSANVANSTEPYSETNILNYSSTETLINLNIHRKYYNEISPRTRIKNISINDIEYENKIMIKSPSFNNEVKKTLFSDSDDEIFTKESVSERKEKWKLKIKTPDSQTLKTKLPVVILKRIPPELLSPVKVTLDEKTVMESESVIKSQLQSPKAERSRRRSKRSLPSRCYALLPEFPQRQSARRRVVKRYDEYITISSDSNSPEKKESDDKNIKLHVESVNMTKRLSARHKNVKSYKEYIRNSRVDTPEKKKESKEGIDKKSNVLSPEISRRQSTRKRIIKNCDEYIEDSRCNLDTSTPEKKKGKTSVSLAPDMPRRQSNRKIIAKKYDEYVEDNSYKSLPNTPVKKKDPKHAIDDKKHIESEYNSTKSHLESDTQSPELPRRTSARKRIVKNDNGFINYSSNPSSPENEDDEDDNDVTLSTEKRRKKSVRKRIGKNYNEYISNNSNLNTIEKKNESKHKNEDKSDVHYDEKSIKLKRTVKDDIDNDVTSKKSKVTRTPRSRKSVKNLAAIIEQRDEAVKACGTPMQRARVGLAAGRLPSRVPCRDNEYSVIYNFVVGRIKDQNGGCMYISGVPGTGKTMTVCRVMEDLESNNDQDTPEFVFLQLNALALTEPRQIYVEIIKKLLKKSLHWEQALNALIKFFTEKKKKTSHVILIDELDKLCNKKQDVIYILLDLPFQSVTPLTIITIANTMDLPERILTNKVNSRLGLVRLTFKPYSYKDLVKIVTERLSSEKVFKSEALELVARKVAAVSGDARRALAMCSRATEIAEEESQALITVDIIDRVVNEMISSSKVRAIKSCSKMEKLILSSISNEVSRTGNEEVSFGNMIHKLKNICLLENIDVPAVGLCQKLCQNLGSYRLLITQHGRLDINMTLLLNISTDDIHFALR